MKRWTGFINNDIPAVVIKSQAIRGVYIVELNTGYLCYTLGNC